MTVKVFGECCLPVLKIDWFYLEALVSMKAYNEKQLDPTLH